MSGERLTILQSLNRALHAALSTDKRVYILGEDVLDPYGGAFKVTRGLSSAFPDRVITTPVSEAALTGLAGGMALRGLRPVVEIMFGDFITLCADQLINHLAKYRAMYGGMRPVPVVIRTPMGGGRGYGPTHSQSLEKLFLGVPYLSTVVPSRFHDPGQLLLAAIADPEPVLFVEHKLLYPLRLIGQVGDSTPLRIESRGAGPYPCVFVSNHATSRPDVTLFTYGGCSAHAEELLLMLQEEEIKVTCILVSRLNRLDADLLADAAAVSTAGCVIWEEGTHGFDWGAELISVLHARLGRDMPPVRRVSAQPTILPAARHLEAGVLSSANTAAQAVLSLVAEVL